MAVLELKCNQKKYPTFTLSRDESETIGPVGSMKNYKSECRPHSLSKTVVAGWFWLSAIDYC